MRIDDARNGLVFRLAQFWMLSRYRGDWTVVLAQLDTCWRTPDGGLVSVGFERGRNSLHCCFRVVTVSTSLDICEDAFGPPASEFTHRFLAADRFDHINGLKRDGVVARTELFPALDGELEVLCRTAAGCLIPCYRARRAGFCHPFFNEFVQMASYAGG